MTVTQPSLEPDVTGVAEAAAHAGRRGHGRGGGPWTIVGKVLIVLLLLGFAALFLYPFAWLLAASLKPKEQVFDNSLIPHVFQWGNYREVWKQLPLIHWILNSIAIAFLAAGFVAISSSIVAFGFAYFRFPFRTVLFGLVLGTMMLPASVTM